MGTVLQHFGRHSEALQLHDRAIHHAPFSAKANHNRANALLALGRFDEAREGFERVLKIAPDFAGSHNGRGAAFQRLGRLEEAASSYRRALSLNENYGEAANNLGIVLREAGDIEEARHYLRAAVACSPRTGQYYRSLIETLAEDEAARHLPAMESLLGEMPPLPESDAIELRFALGKAYDDIGRFDEAFEHFQVGNQQQRAKILYNEAREIQVLESLRSTFTPELARSAGRSGDASTRPLFIVGMPRSGTTLIEQILAGHPGVHAAGELEALENAVAMMPRVHPGSGLHELREAISALSDSYLLATESFAKAAFVTDKMPSNFRFAGLINLAFPNARIIDVRRDPLDTCLSCYATHFAGNLNFTYDLAELGHYYRAYRRLMDYWVKLISPARILTIHYERLIDNPEQECRRLLDFCDLEWHASCLEFHRVQRPIRTASHSQVRRPLYSSSVGRAKRYGEHLRPLIEALNDPP